MAGDHEHGYWFGSFAHRSEVAGGVRRAKTHVRLKTLRLSTRRSHVPRTREHGLDAVAKLVIVVREHDLPRRYEPMKSAAVSLATAESVSHTASKIRDSTIVQRDRLALQFQGVS
jgi:hypothetical protein